MSVKSPVTLSANTELIETVPVKYIIEEYKRILDMDVSAYFEGLEKIYIYRCNDTGFRFYYPENIFGDEQFYADLQKMDFYYNDWLWEHKTALENIPPGSRVLEVGCGTGSFMKTLVKKGFDITGLELNNEAVKVCRENGLTVFNELLEAHIIKHAGEYDVVCAFQVLEHVYDVHSFIDCCIKCLKPGGKLIIGVPNNNPWLYMYDKYHAMNMPPHHSGLWDKSSFSRLTSFFPLRLIKTGFEPLYNRVQFLQIYLRHKKSNKLLKMLGKIHPGIINRLFFPLRYFIKGKCILVVFEKV